MSKKGSNPFVWGIILIVIGILFTMRSLWDINFPVFRVALSLFLIGLGVIMVMGRFGLRRGENSTILSDSQLSYSPSESNYGCILGKLELDLTTVDPTVQKEIEIMCTLGEIRINVSKDTRLMIKSNTTLGETRFPNNTEYNFGTGTYESPDLDSGQPYLMLKCRNVLGNMKIYTV